MAKGAFDPKAFLANYNAKPADEFDYDAFLRGTGPAQSNPSAPQGSSAEMQPSKAMHVQQVIDRGMLPAPTFTDKLKAALDPSEIAGDLEAAAARVNDRATAGILPKAMEATGLVAPGRFEQLERERPIASAAGELPAAAASMATGAPQLFGKAGAALVGKLGGQALPAAAKTVAGSAAASGMFGASDQAIRSSGELGGKQGPITSEDVKNAAGDVLASGGIGVATGGLMSALPGAASAVEDFAHQRVLSSDLRPIKQMAKKGSLDKSLLQFGKDNPEEGAKAMREFVDRENLGPAFRKKGFKMETEFNKRMDRAWKEGAGPVIEKAFEIDPKASAQMSEIEEAIQKLAPNKGTPDSLLVNKALARLKELQADAGAKGGKFPLRSLLETARAFQSEGHAGVVNYDEPTANKEMARKIGHELKSLVNSKIGMIYAKHPEAARELLNYTPMEPHPSEIVAREQPAKPPVKTLPRLRSPNDPIGQAIRDIASDELGLPREATPTPKSAKAPRKPKVDDNLFENPDVAAVGERLREGNERFSDYKKMERMIGEAGKAKAGEKHRNLIGHLLHGAGATTAGLVGGLVDHSLILPSIAAYETGRIGYPYAMRATEAAARFGAGVPVDPRLRLTAPQLQALRDSPEAFREFRKRFRQED